jgi:hypothetical protein
LTEENGLRAHEKRVLKIIFGPRRDQVKIEEWIKLQNAELNDLYYSPSIVRVIKSRKMRTHIGESRGVYRFLVWETSGK